MNAMTEQQQPEQPVPIKRHFELYPIQMIGIPIMLLVVLLACFGVLTSAQTEVVAASSTFRVKLTYPERTRYGSEADFVVAVENLTEQPLALVTVRIDSSYVDAFEIRHIAPQQLQFSAGGLELLFADIPPSETRMIQLELQGEYIGDVSSTISAFSSDSGSAQTTIHTLILP
ncbi:MAG: hypothetical protein KF726_05610 [Anaerolineae bacterium]|nr:hypothetical protein [Anaerolineae bacterium]